MFDLDICAAEQHLKGQAMRLLFILNLMGSSSLYPQITCRILYRWHEWVGIIFLNCNLPDILPAYHVLVIVLPINIRWMHTLLYNCLTTCRITRITTPFFSVDSLFGFAFSILRNLCDHHANWTMFAVFFFQATLEYLSGNVAVTRNQIVCIVWSGVWNCFHQWKWFTGNFYRSHHILCAFAFSFRRSWIVSWIFSVHFFFWVFHDLNFEYHSRRFCS